MLINHHEGEKTYRDVRAYLLVLRLEALEHELSQLRAVGYVPIRKASLRRVQKHTTEVWVLEHVEGLQSRLAQASQRKFKSTYHVRMRHPVHRILEELRRLKDGRHIEEAARRPTVNRIVPAFQAQGEDHPAPKTEVMCLEVRANAPGLVRSVCPFLAIPEMMFSPRIEENNHIPTGGTTGILDA